MDNKKTGLWALVEKYREIVLYLFFGGVTTLVSWGSYWLFMLILPFENKVSFSIFGLELAFTLNVFAANVLSWLCAVTVAFVTNKLWVFESRSWEGRLVLGEAVTFVGGRLLTGALEIVSLPVLVGAGMDQTLFGVEGFPAKMLISLVVIILNYILSKFISFRKVKGESSESPGEE